MCSRCSGNININVRRLIFRMLEKLRKFKEEKRILEEKKKRQSKPAFKVPVLGESSSVRLCWCSDL